MKAPEEIQAEWDHAIAEAGVPTEKEMREEKGLFGIRCWLATSDNLPQNRISVLTPAPADRIP